MANLAATYRPKTFDDVTEQSVIVNMLKNICNQDTINHRNFLFIGPAGTGKTTTGRIVANMVNGGKGEPIEIDAASHNGVESMRELVKQMRSYPVGFKYKVFIIDECHSLSSQSWQILLKPIEEQPAKTIIILCTTNPEKIPATILSRVQTFQLSKISLDGIISRLKYIVEEENKLGRNITYTDDAISYIAKLANGGMRDSITLLEKSLSFSEDITIENLTKSLDLPNYDDYFVLLNGIAKKDNQVIVSLINEVYNSGVNFVKWFEGFHSFISNIIKYIFIQDINATMIPSHYADKVSNYGTAHAILCLKLANVLVKMNHELKSTQYLQELAITYLCQMPQQKRG